ncbi:MAG: OmpA family protein, partial [Deltaproteobacteria bacterium]|nr:OmpA family protein [Deltaproteobacteria bacterium]
MVEKASCGSPPPQGRSMWSVDHHSPGDAQDGRYDFAPRPLSGTMRWSIPWADLMMTMLILFVILYAYYSPGRRVSRHASSSIGPHAGGAVQAQPEPGSGNERMLKPESSIADIYDMSVAAVRTDDLRSVSKIDLVPDKAVRIILASDLLFDTGKAELKPGAKRSLERIGRIIATSPYVVNVVGHTDDIPIHSDRFPTNWELSALRACRVARFLIETMNLAANRFYISGHSYYRPMFPNSSEMNRAANRRVEIIITKELPQARPAMETASFYPGW